MSGRLDEHPTPRADRDAGTLAPVRAHALAHLAEPRTVATPAARADMSPRLLRPSLPGPPTGTSPLRWLITQRAAATRKPLEQTDPPLPEGTLCSGFGSEITMRQHFATHLSTSPRDYRRAFLRTLDQPEVDTARPHP